MFRRNKDVTTAQPVEARGGIAGGAILTGVVVAFGAMFLLSALIGGILAALGVAEADITRGEAIDAGIGAGMAFVVAQFLSYLWGGYTAGRMARGAGLGNGVLVPVTALILGAITLVVVGALGATANLNLPFTENRLPLENDYLVNWGIGIGIASLIAMFLGAAIGGSMGARWHTKLERDVYDETPVKTRDGDELRDRTTPATTGGAAARDDHTIDLNRDDRTDTHRTETYR
ncbi:MAG: hypothetical protein KY391_06245 [Actinobacteria bacterium]|nr:hypothetical protein [Actinomycetota bacterium]